MPRKAHCMKRQFILIIVIIVAAVGAVIGRSSLTDARGSSAGSAAPVSPCSTDDRGRAFGGYDLVAFADGNSLVPGQTSIRVTSDSGCTFLFATSANAERFQQTPGKYEPSFGGYCVAGLARFERVAGDPRWAIRADNRTLCFAGEEAAKRWQADGAQMLRLAEVHWPIMNSRGTPSSPSPKRPPGHP